MIAQKSWLACRITEPALILSLILLLFSVRSNLVAGQQPPLQIDQKLIHETVQSVATVIKAEYFDAATAEKTSAAVLERLAQGHYANSRGLEDLAKNLASDLLELTSDKHLVVAVTRDRDAEPLPKQEPSDDSRKADGRRDNFGIQRVELATWQHRLSESHVTVSPR